MIFSFGSDFNWKKLSQRSDKKKHSFLCNDSCGVQMQLIVFLVLGMGHRHAQIIGSSSKICPVASVGKWVQKWKTVPICLLHAIIWVWVLNFPNPFIFKATTVIPQPEVFRFVFHLLMVNYPKKGDFQPKFQTGSFPCLYRRAIIPSTQTPSRSLFCGLCATRGSGVPFRLSLDISGRYQVPRSADWIQGRNINATERKSRLPGPRREFKWNGFWLIVGSWMARKIHKISWHWRKFGLLK